MYFPESVVNYRGNFFYEMWDIPRCSFRSVAKLNEEPQSLVPSECILLLARAPYTFNRNVIVTLFRMDLKYRFTGTCIEFISVKICI